jgi:tRNA (Thr-GGU) A37 N-methylase
METMNAITFTPAHVLDIKPYIETFDRVEESRSGWLASFPEEIARRRSDRRFT